MSSDPLFWLVVIALGSVALILTIGIGGFARGGEFNRKHGNRMMRWRIIAQAIALVIIMIYVTIRGV